jgi:hypothetical protein
MNRAGDERKPLRFHSRCQKPGVLCPFRLEDLDSAHSRPMVVTVLKKPRGIGFAVLQAPFALVRGPKKPALARSRNRFNRRGDERIRTAVQGFADPCLATRPRHRLQVGTPGRTRTCNLRIRSPLLYPIELQARDSWRFTSGRGGRIRTCDLLLPKQTR